jgi:hypothetical protein
MSPKPFFSRVGRRALLSALAVLPALPGSLLPMSARAQAAALGGTLPSWNNGATQWWPLKKFYQANQDVRTGHKRYTAEAIKSNLTY